MPWHPPREGRKEGRKLKEWSLLDERSQDEEGGGEIGGGVIIGRRVRGFVRWGSNDRPVWRVI